MRESKVYGPGEKPGLVHVGEVCVAVRGSAVDVALFLHHLEELVASTPLARVGDEGTESLRDELRNLYELVVKAGAR